MNSLPPESNNPHTTRPLPKGWRWVKLGDVCQFQHGSTPSKANPAFWSGCVPWASPKDIYTDVLFTTQDFISEKATRETRIAMADAGTLLLVVRSGVLIHTLPIAIAARPMAFNQDIKGIFPQKSVLNSAFLRWQLKSQQTFILKEGVKQGATVQSVRSGFIENLEIPLPPLEEQERIASILTEQMAAIDKARAAAQERLAAIHALPNAFLRQVFPQADQPLPKGWRWVKLGDVCQFEMGQSPHGGSYNKDGIGTPLLNGPSEFGDAYPTAVQWTTEPTKFAHKGDILFCVRGATTGRRNIADRSYCIGRGLAAIRAITDYAEMRFIWMVLDVFVGDMLKSAHGSIFVNLSAQDISNFRVPLPPLEEQERIASILTEQMAAIDKARAAAQEQLDTLQALPAAILRQAFNGEL